MKRYPKYRSRRHDTNDEISPKPNGGTDQPKILLQRNGPAVNIGSNCQQLKMQPGFTSNHTQAETSLPLNTPNQAQIGKTNPILTQSPRKISHQPRTDNHLSTQSQPQFQRTTKGGGLLPTPEFPPRLIPTGYQRQPEKRAPLLPTPRITGRTPIPDKPKPPFLLPTPLIHPVPTPLIHPVPSVHMQRNGTTSKRNNRRWRRRGGYQGDADRNIGEHYKIPNPEVHQARKSQPVLVSHKESGEIPCTVTADQEKWNDPFSSQRSLDKNLNKQTPNNSQNSTASKHYNRNRRQWRKNAKCKPSSENSQLKDIQSKFKEVIEPSINIPSKSIPTPIVESYQIQDDKKHCDQKSTINDINTPQEELVHKHRKLKDTSKSSSNESMIQKSCSKKESLLKKITPSTKVTVRRLPPNITKDEFFSKLPEVPEYNYFHIQNAEEDDRGNTPYSYSTLWVNFFSTADALDFMEKVQRITFEDSFRRKTYFATADFAMCQREMKKKCNVYRGTLEQCADYQEFLKTLEEGSKQTYKGPSISEMVDIIDTKKQFRKSIKAPLVEYILNTRTLSKSTETKQSD